MPTLSFSKTDRIITVELPDTEVTVQELINAVRDWEDELVNTEVPKVADASGKDDLGGGLAVGITLKLLNWKVKFEDRSGPDWVDCSVTGGNLIAVDANNQPMNPIEPAAYVTVTVEKAVSGVRIADVAEWTQAEKSDHISVAQAVKSKTDNLPSNPAAQSSVQDVKDVIGVPTSPTIADDLDAVEEEILTAKGVGWTDETLKKLAELIESIRVGVGFRV